LRGLDRIEIGKRTIPTVVITKALVVALVGLMIIVGATFLILITERDTIAQQPEVRFMSLLFEVVSAFGTVGLSILSTAATGAMTWAGKAIIIITMFIGRLGPLALAEMVLTAEKPLSYKYPEEYLLVG